MRRFSLAIALLILQTAPALAATALSVGPISPKAAIVDQSIQLSAVFFGDAAVDSCSLFVDGKKAGSATVKDTVAIATHRFAEAKTYEAYIQCADIGGNLVNGPVVGISVGFGSTNAKPGDRLKMTCPSEVPVNHPCTTVYFYGADGRRHAFPNEGVYKQWFKDFANVVLLSPEALAAVPLGRMVTHRPGYALVKFPTVNTVYAVSYAGVLRPIANGDIAQSLFGAVWTTGILDISDAFFTQYRVGRLIDSTRDYEASKVKSSADSINDIL